DLVDGAQDDVGEPDVGVRLAPEPAAERAARIEHALEQLADEARIGAVEAVRLASEDAERRHGAALVAVALAIADQEPGRRDADRDRGRMVLEIIDAGIVEIGDIEVARGDRERADDAADRNEWCAMHGV